MLHGNPTWSYVFRHLIVRLRDRFRCIAPDLPGFGLSQAPDGYGFTPEEHATIVSAFVDELGLASFTPVVQDWGGPIGLYAASRIPERVERLVIGNTWCWPVNGDFHFEAFSRVMGGPIGRFGIRNFNAFVNAFMPAGINRTTVAGRVATFEVDCAPKGLKQMVVRNAVTAAICLHSLVRISQGAFSCVWSVLWRRIPALS